MKKIKKPEELENLKKSILKKRESNKPCITVCAGTGCCASGSEEVITAFKKSIKQKKLEKKAKNYGVNLSTLLRIWFIDKLKETETSRLAR